MFSSLLTYSPLSAGIVITAAVHARRSSGHHDHDTHLNMETETIIIVSVFGGAWLALLVACIVLCVKVSGLRRQIQDLNASGRLRVQKLTMSSDKNHAFNNPTLSPDEELSRRGYSMYQPDDDVESGRGTERQTGGQLIDELAKEIDHRQQRQTHNSQPQHNPPFLLQSIENSKMIRSLANPVASQGRQSDTNPNFMY